MAEYRELLPGEAGNVLVENREELVRQITPKDVINSLFQRRVIDLDDLNDIKQEERQHGRRAGVEKLLDRIHHSGVDGLDKFIESLKSSGYNTLAKKLQESRQTQTHNTDEEQANIPSAGENNINRFGKSDIKPSGKFPSWHKEILRKNYLIIMENIRVNDVIDHLFSSEVIDSNDMDVLKTKLKSEGNREALSYLMDVLLKSSHTTLSTFIKCLLQTGYSHVAQHLQDEIDSTKQSENTSPASNV